MPEQRPEEGRLEHGNRAQIPGEEQRRADDSAGSTRSRAALKSLFRKIEAQDRDATLGGASKGGVLDWDKKESSQRTDYSTLVERVVSRMDKKRQLLAKQREQAPVLMSELLRHPPERRQVLLNNSQRYRNLPLCDVLLEESLESGFRNPMEAVELAELAIDVADRLDPESFSRAVIYDVRARSWTFLANARRISGEYRTAAEAFRRAEVLLAGGTGDLLERARFFAFKATLHSDLSQYEQALALFDRAIHIYRRSGDDQLLGQLLIRKGLHCGSAGDPLGAIELLREGLKLVDTDQEPRLALAANHSLIINLNELGQQDEALALLENSRPMYKRLGERINLMRLRWLEARLARSRDELEEAERALTEARQAFINQHLTHEAALVSLELAALYLEQGRTAEIKVLARDIFTIFNSIDLKREAFAALVLLEKSAQMETVTLTLIQETMHALARSTRHSGV